jgi:hypothetical protein
MSDPVTPDPVTPDPAEHDLELTVSALKDGPAALGIPGALVEIRRWQQRIDGTAPRRWRRSALRWPSYGASWRATPRAATWSPT